jgi:HD-GYP domain-containing protein (c-di-GMP phosphodiesterase class II)
MLLAPAGMLLGDETQFRRLLAHTPYCLVETDTADEQSRHDTPLQHLTDLAKLIDAALNSLHVASLHAHAMELVTLHQRDPEACLGYASVEKLASPALAHSLRVALVALRVADRLDLEHAKRVSLAAAALSMNVAAWELHDRYSGFSGTLSVDARDKLREHPQAGAAWLQHAGVDDAFWLEAVHQHHENVNGTGYPDRLSDREISLGARILRVADVYCAKVRRNYQPPRSTHVALHALFGRERIHLDRHLTNLLLRQLGLYPPGMLVRLANRETACISRRGNAETAFYAVSVLDARERKLERLQVREIRNRRYAVIGTAHRHPGWPAIDWKAVWGY